MRIDHYSLIGFPDNFWSIIDDLEGDGEKMQKVLASYRFADLQWIYTWIVEAEPQLVADLAESYGALIDHTKKSSISIEDFAGWAVSGGSEKFVLAYADLESLLQLIPPRGAISLISSIVFEMYTNKYAQHGVSLLMETIDYAPSDKFDWLE